MFVNSVNLALRRTQTESRNVCRNTYIFTNTKEYILFYKSLLHRHLLRLLLPNFLSIWIYSGSQVHTSLIFNYTSVKSLILHNKLMVIIDDLLLVCTYKYIYLFRVIVALPVLSTLSRYHKPITEPY